MKIKLNEFLGVLAYGNKVIIYDTENKKCIYQTDNFKAPYSLDDNNIDLIVECFSVINGVLNIWVKTN